jgi:23S rRNA pseudouridine2605 synthase
VNGEVERSGAARVDPERDRIEVDGRPVAAQKKIYLMLNKPRGMLTTRSDERGRPTVYDCLKGAGLPWVGPVGRLDKASEGLLLFTNDTRWAARIQAPETGPDKIYHVQIEGETSQELLKGMTRGTMTEGDFLRAKKATLLRRGSRNTWLEVVLDEGRNRQIRRLLSAFGVNVLRLIRVSIGPLNLGSLPKGAYRHLTGDEKNFFDY